MTTTIRSWIYDLNAVIAGPTQTDRYQNQAFRWKQNIVGAQPVNLSGAWTIESSSNSVTFSAADNWTTAANVVPNTTGLAHSHITFKSPAGMVPGGFIYMCWDFVVTAPATPDAYQVFVSSFPFTGGSTTARPTAIGEAQANGNQSTFVDSAAACNSHCLRTSIGEFMLFNSVDGSNVVRVSNIGLRPDGGEPGLSWPFWHLAYYGTLVWSNISFSAYSTTYAESGFAALGSCAPVSIAERMGAWVAGISNGSPGRAADGFIDIVGIAAPHNLYVGRVIDVRGAPDLLPPNSDQQGDSPGAGVTVGVKRISLNGLWLPLVTPFVFNL